MKRPVGTLVALAAILVLAACGHSSADPGGGATTPSTTHATTPRSPTHHPRTIRPAISRSHAAPARSSTSPSTSRGHPTSAPHSTPPAPPTPRRGSGKPIHISLFEGDGKTYGVAMPIIAYFSRAPTDARTFDKVVTVTVNGKPAHGAWYWERSSLRNQGLEAHYRPRVYWPAHATIKVNMPVAGLWAGPGLVFQNNVTLTMMTGDRHVVRIDGAPNVEKMWVYDNGKLIHTFGISLGAAKTPTYLGTAVIMAKTNPQLMVSTPGEPFFSIEVPWSLRVTYSGEFLHDAFWNNQIGHANLSHGCTNMSPADAKWYYGWALIGDPVTWWHTGTNQVVPVWDGWGDWNLDWATYQQGGELHP